MLNIIKYIVVSYCATTHQIFKSLVLRYIEIFASLSEHDEHYVLSYLPPRNVHTRRSVYISPFIQYTCARAGGDACAPHSTNAKLVQKHDHRKFIRVGPKGYVLPTGWLDHSEDVRTLPLRPDDIFVASFPRSGTTWTQELVWLIANDMDFEKAKSIPLTTRYPFLEDFMFRPWDAVKDPDEKKRLESAMRPAPEVLASTPSPRFIKSHLPMSLLPEGTLDTARVVYVARDPRDVAVSCYHFFKSFKENGLTVPFKDYHELFINNLETWAPFFDHVKEAWYQRNHPNMLFLFYEELSKDLGSVARRVAGFLGKQYTDEQYARLLDHLKFDNFQKNTAVDLVNLRALGLLEDKGQNFIRKGKAGGWRDNYDEEMIRRTEQWMADNLRDMDLRFEQN